MKYKTKIKFLNLAKESNAVGIIRPHPHKKINKYQSQRKLENEEKKL